VIGHDHVSNQQEFIPLTNLAESLHEEISRLHGAEQLQPSIATEREEVQIPAPMAAFQIFGHVQNPHA